MSHPHDVLRAVVSRGVPIAGRPMTHIILSVANNGGYWGMLAESHDAETGLQDRRRDPHGVPPARQRDRRQLSALGRDLEAGMTARDLSTLRVAADTADTRFEAACRAHGFRDRWEFYRAGDNAPAGLLALHDEMIAALYAFYLARDGGGGFLGSRGV